MDSIKKEHFGHTKDGKKIDKYTLTGTKVTVCVINYGCAITNIFLPDKNGVTDDIVLGYDNVAGYEENLTWIGVACGRTAGRITNAQFTIDGQTTKLPANYDGVHSIHGGQVGFSRRVWDAQIVDNKLVLKYISPDGEEGFPGELTTEIVYSLSKDDVLTIDYTATTTKACPLNFTNHSYFNLGGQKGEEIFDHVAQISADKYVPVGGESLLPTGELPPVDGRPVDIRKPTRLGDIEEHIKKGSLDINYCVGETGKMKKISRIDHPPSGRFIETESTEPGLQFYLASFLRDVIGKGGKEYKPYTAFCLEAQHYPDSTTYPNFPNTVLRPGETYRQTTSYKFGSS